KEVFVVPGRLTDELSRGCNRLLWEGANPAVSPQKVFEYLYGACAGESNVINAIEYTVLQKQILSFLDVTPVHINVLQEQMGLPIEVLSKELLFMSLNESVIQVGHNWYQRNVK
ncbi:MAG: hypothetical protein IJ274_07125, partial [Lachnospiraceae bacterium]|nr:hypothetical protein [Lachnospiraceae bacterium]